MFKRSLPVAVVENSPTTLEIVEAIVDLFSPEELKSLEVNFNEYQASFKKLMLAYYRNMFPKYSIETSKTIAKDIIDQFKTLLNLEPKAGINKIVVENFSVLFEEHKH